MFAFDRNFAAHPSQARMVHTSWRWKGLGNTGPDADVTQLGPLCREEGGGRDGALMENKDRWGLYTSATISDACGEETINTR